MNDNYYTEQTSHTIGTITIAGIIVTQLLLTPPLNIQQKELDMYLYRSNVYQSSASSATFDQFRNVVTGEYYHEIDQFEAAISDFYATLIANQELLGIEFEKVRYENLWNLYEI
jgi:hypothetical protein